LVSALVGRFGGDGSISRQVNLTAFGVLALRAAAVPVPGPTMGWLLRQQNRDGGFSFATAGAPSDIDDTGAALEALAAGGGASSAEVHRAAGYLRAQQNSDGGFPQQGGGGSNAQSTAWATQGLLAAGVDPGSVTRAGRSPIGYLRSLIAPDGHIRYATGADQTPVWVTAEALMALAEKPLPLAPPHVSNARRRPTPPRASTPARGRRRTTPATGTAGAGGAHAREARRKPAHRPAAGTRAIEKLAADTGVLSAVLLAPVGVG
jgi:energy-coupling factor transport system substrate-specific component